MPSSTVLACDGAAIFPESGNREERSRSRRLIVSQVLGGYKGDTLNDIWPATGRAHAAGQQIMWRRIVAQRKARKASRAAVSLVGPLVANSRRRLNGIPASIWTDPYVIGLIITMITVAARLESETVEGQMLCKVQQDAWAKITGAHAALIGEEVLLLSSARDPDFVLGCHDALDFGPSFYRGQTELSDYHAAVEGGLDWSENIRRENTYGSVQEQIWARYFDAHCMR